jgi:hypothetical protein
MRFSLDEDDRRLLLVMSSSGRRPRPVERLVATLLLPTDERYPKESMLFRFKLRSFVWSSFMLI